MDVLRKLAEMGGAARRSDLVATSTDGRRLAACVAAGEVIDHGGCYALPGAAEWLVRARQFRGALTCVSWAQQAGLALLERPRAVHLAVPAARSPSRSSVRPPRSVVLHRSPWVARGRLPEPPAVPAAEAVACLLRCLEPLAAIVTTDSALNRGACSRSDLHAHLRGPGSALAVATLARCDGRSESVLESVARVVLREVGLSVEVNVPVPGVCRVDLVVEGRVIVELDGFEHHGTRLAFGEDRRRDRALVALGFRVLRFTYDEVVNTPGTVAAAVRAALVAPARPVA